MGFYMSSQAVVSPFFSNAHHCAVDNTLQAAAYGKPPHQSVIRGVVQMIARHAIICQPEK